MTRLRTERLDLRPFAVSELEELHLLFTDAEVRRFLLDGEVVPVEWVRDEIDASDHRFEELSCGLWAVRLTDSPEIIGFVGFRPFFDPPDLQLLYGFLASSWGRGLATEAAAEVLRYAFEELDFDEVHAATDVPNEASARVLRRLRMNERKRTNEGPAGTVYYSIARDEWRSSSPTSPRRPAAPPR